MEATNIVLEQHEMPRQWYNLAADLPSPLHPPLGPDGKPVSPAKLAAVFPENLIEQEVSTQRWIDIPEDVLGLLSLWRPSPLLRATRLEKALGTPARIYYKYEGVSPGGSHKANTAVAQAWYNKQFGIEKLTTETGAGQWGSALACACALIGLKCTVFMVRVSFAQKPLPKGMMEIWGATCIPSPSDLTQSGREILKRWPQTPGSLGIAISEAVESALADKTGKTRYSLGSVLNHVLLHQTIIGLEAKKQLAKIGASPDVVVGCAGGGSNFAGLAFPFVADKIHGANMTIIPAEPESCPSLTRGKFAYDHGDTAKLTPLLPMYTLGHDFVPPTIHAGGLRYHGMAPLVSQATYEGLLQPRALPQNKCYQAALMWARTEGVIPAPETSHAIATVIDEAKKAKEEGKQKTILFCFSGHGLLDLSGYDKFMRGELTDHPLPESELCQGLQGIATHPALKAQKSGKW